MSSFIHSNDSFAFSGTQAFCFNLSRESTIASLKTGCWKRKALTWPPGTQRTSDPGQWAASCLMLSGVTYASSSAPTMTAASGALGLQQQISQDFTVRTLCTCLNVPNQSEPISSSLSVLTLPSFVPNEYFQGATNVTPQKL